MAAILLLRHSQNEKLEIILEHRSREKERLFDRLVQLKGEKLKIIVENEYTIWDEMVSYIRQDARPRSFEENALNTLLSDYQFDAVWVFNPRFDQIYSVTDEEMQELNTFPFSKEQLTWMMQSDRKVHFFVKTSFGLMEIRGASVHPTNDPQRQSTDEGYLFSGIVWNKAHLEELGEMNTAQISIEDISAAGTTENIENKRFENGALILHRPMYGWNDRPLSVLRVTFPMYLYNEIQQSGYRDLTLIIFLSAVLLTLFFLLLVRWIHRPLSLISDSLITENLSRIKSLINTQNEFGEISKLIEQFFQQKVALTKEIEQRKLASKELELKSAYLDQLIENAPEAVVIVDNTDHVLRINSEFTRMFGYQAHEAIGKDINSLIVPEELSDLATFISNRVTEGQKANIESLRRRKDGSLIEVSILGAPVHTESGQVGVYGIYRDISDRKAMEVKLEKSEKYYRSLIENSLDVVAVLDLGGLITYNSPSLEKALSLERDEMVGQSAFTLIHPDDQFKTRSVFEAAAANPGSNYTIEARVRNKDGTWGIWQIKGVCVTGEESYIVVNATDITLRKSAEDKIRQLSGAVEQSPVSVVITDRDGRIEYVNPWFKEITGYSLEEVIGKRPSLLKSGFTSDSEYQNLWKTIISGGRWRGEFHNRRKNGELYWESATISGIKDAAGRIINFIAVKEDITERKAAEKELIEARERAEAAMRAKSDFLATMSHEIRTPMNGVIGMTDLLLDSDLNPEQRDYVRTIQSSGDTLLAVINDILDYSKIDSGKLDLEKQPLNLITGIETTLDVFSAKASKKNIELIYSIDPLVPVDLIGDETRIKQILMNLVNNALKFTEKGEIFISVKPGSTAENTGDIELLFSVKDTGIGIPHDKMDRLFKSFSQVDSSTTRKYGGTGLGLAISARLVQLMGGRIWVESVEGSGSTFSFTIRVGVNQDSQFKEEIDMMILRNKRVLIVDDNQTNRQILSFQCNRMAMVPFVTGSPKEAIEWIGHGQGFDLAILDMHMPEMDGFELGLAIREIRSKEFLPLLMLSSIGKKGMPENYPDDVFSVFLAKPVKQDQLKEKVRHIFGAPKKENKVAGNTIDGKLADRLPLQILLAEDNAINQKLAVLTFEKMGYRVDVANNGFEALYAVQQKVYDIIFMDMQMPEMDGLEATRRIRALLGDGPPRIVAMTANAMKEDRDQCFEAGMDDFITKPILIKQIQSKLIEWGESMQPETTNTTSAKQIIDAGHLTDIGITADFFKELADMYIDQSKTLISEIKSYAHTGELSGFRQIAHTLKGISANIGAVAMVDACQALEKVQPHHRPKEINVLLHQLGIVHEETCFHLEKSLLDEHFLRPEAAA